MEKIGRYEILSELGRGAMGVVYSAMDPLIGRQVAVKTIRLDTLEASQNREELTRRLFREAQSAGILSHPGIITIHDVGEFGNEAYIVMEYVDGKTLEALLASGVPQHSDMLVSILKQAAVALDYAHEKGIIHRDIKPSNIMICRDRSVKIADFGVAKLSESTTMTQSGMVLGTPSYMSPEQAQGHSLDGRSDQFSLAVIAYRMLTGMLPFEGTTLTALLTKILLEEPKYDSSGLHPYLQRVFKRALAKIPQFRFPTCTEFVNDMEAAYSLCRSEQARLAANAVSQAAPPEDWSAALPEASPSAKSPPLEVTIPEAAPPEESPAVEAPVPMPLDSSAPEMPAAAAAEAPSVPPPKQESVIRPANRNKKLLTWAMASVAVLAVLAMILFAIKGTQHEEAPVQSSFPDVADNAGITPESDSKEEFRESIPITSVPPQPKPEEKIAEPPKPEPPKKIAIAPDTSPAPKPKPSAPSSKPASPVSGVITWSGTIGRNAILVITGPEASIGSVTGELPGQPVAIEVDPKEVTIRVMPNEENGWKQLMLHSGSQRQSSITIRWKILK